MSEFAFSLRRLAAPAALVAAGLIAAPALAGEAPSPNATINLINLMVKRGLITKADAEGLIAQAEAEAASARAATAPAPATPAAADAGTTVAVPNRDGTVRVQYVPEMVRKQIRDEVRSEVMAQAKKEGWATPNAIPDWTQRVKVTGDVRLRYEGDYLGDTNSSGSLWNYNAINTGSPFDDSSTNTTTNPPTLNVDEDRSRFRLRARLGVAADLADGVSTGVRIATGEGSSPVTTNQSLGASGGNFSKYAVWLDRAYIRYQGDVATGLALQLDGGRFDNPFFSTDILWDDDLGFDGLAASARYDGGGSAKPFATLGAFPVFNTDFNFASTEVDKYSSDDKWLLGGQIGVDWKIATDYRLKAALAYYHFDNIKGEFSNPCDVISSSTACDTDATRPSFAQKGNTYMPLRNITPTAANDYGASKQYQYYGLVTGFRELALTARLDLSQFKTLPVALDGEYVKNLAFDEDRARANAINNLGTNGRYEGGDTAFMARLTLGTEAVRKRWDWNLRLAYKYLESDSVVDGFNDSDFGLGGTNIEGYVFGGALGLADNVSLGLRWQSANSIAGPEYSADVLQADLNARF